MEVKKEKNNKDYNEQNENIKNKDFFDKYSTYFTLNIIISFLDIKSLYRLMPLKRRFYELIQNKLNNEDNLILPMFKDSCNNLDDLFTIYFIYVLKGLKTSNPEKEKERIIFNILKNFEGNYLNINTQFCNIRAHFLTDENYLNLLIKESKDNSISLEQFAKKYLNFFKTFDVLNYINIINNYFPQITYEYCNFIYYILKLHKFVFDSKTHKPKFEKIEVGRIHIGMKLTNKNGGWYLSYDDDDLWRYPNMNNIYPSKFLGKNVISNCIDLNVNLENVNEEQSNFRTGVIKGSDYTNVKNFKLYSSSINHFKIIEITTTSQILEFVYLENILINFDSIYILVKSSKNNLKKIVFDKLELSNKSINDISLRKIYKSIIDLKMLESAEFKMIYFPKKLIVFLLSAFYEKFFYSTLFKYFNLSSEMIGTQNSFDFSFQSFDKIKKETKLMEEKLKNLNCGEKDENQRGFFSKMNDFNYEIYVNENKENISSLTINEVAEKQNFKDKNLIVDGAHNPNCFQALRDNLDSFFPCIKRNYVFGCLNTKDYKSMLEYIITDPYKNKLFVYHFNNPNSVTYETLNKFAPCEELSDLSEVLSDEILTVVCGSFYMLNDLIPQNSIFTF